MNKTKKELRGCSRYREWAWWCLATFALEVFSPQRFDNSKQVASYLGLAPTVRQSGEKTQKAKIKPCGQKYLRSLLIEAPGY